MHQMGLPYPALCAAAWALSTLAALPAAPGQGRWGEEAGVEGGTCPFLLLPISVRVTQQWFFTLVNVVQQLQLV